jgi:hypothetical protein
MRLPQIISARSIVIPAYIVRLPRQQVVGAMLRRAVTSGSETVRHLRVGVVVDGHRDFSTDDGNVNRLTILHEAKEGVQKAKKEAQAAIRAGAADEDRPSNNAEQSQVQQEFEKADGMPGSLAAARVSSDEMLRNDTEGGLPPAERPDADLVPAEQVQNLNHQPHYPPLHKPYCKSPAINEQPAEQSQPTDFHITQGGRDNVANSSTMPLSSGDVVEELAKHRHEDRMQEGGENECDDPIRHAQRWVGGSVSYASGAAEVMGVAQEVMDEAVRMATERMLGVGEAIAEGAKLSDVTAEMEEVKRRRKDRKHEGGENEG